MSTTSTFPGMTELEEFPIPKASSSLRMTEEQFFAWCEADEDARAEWVDGKVIIMAADNIIHLDLNLWLGMLMRLFVDRRKLGGRVFGSGCLLRFAALGRVRIPDVLYISPEREPLLRRARMEGAPDIAAEIVSPESQSRDRREKFLEYEKAGVREYWIIDPLSQTVEAYALDGSGAYASIDPTDGKIASTVLPGFYLKPEWLWQEKLPDTIEILREMGVQI